MQFPVPLIPATLVRRYKRFLADVTLPDGSEITAHVANPGAMTGLATPGARVWLSRSEVRTRKLPYSWELVDVDLGAGLESVSVNTGLTNAVIAEAITAQAIPELGEYTQLRREVSYGDGASGVRSRIDFLLTSPDRPDCWVEVKAVSLMRQPRRAEFPDAVTARGARHLAELAAIAGSGSRAVLLFAVQMASATSLGVARDIDPAYGKALDAAQAAGVEVLAYTCVSTPDGITLGKTIPFA